MFITDKFLKLDLSIKKASIMDTHGVVVRSVRALRGGNLYAYMPVLHIIMEIGEYDERPSNSFPGFVERITEWLPGLQKHECSVGKPGGFIERLRRGTYLAHITEHITLELQNLMGFNVRFGRARGAGEPGVYRVVIAYKEEEPARAAFETALRMTLAAMHEEPFDVEGEIERLMEIADHYRLGPSTAAIVAAARGRRIPVLRLTPTGSLVQLGYGVYQKRILASETSLTSSIAVEMCQEKPLTNRILRSVGVPVPEGRSAHSADEAWEIAQDVGLPVVVKPEDGNQGKGVSVNLTTEAEVREAYTIASAFSGVLVERFIVGKDYRLLIVNGKMVAASRRDPAQVIGDGQHTVRELVDIVNQDPRRRPGHSSILTRIRIDEAAKLVLSQQGMTEDSIPEPGQVVRLRTNSNLSTGGTAADVTDEVHPQNAQLAELAAQILNLDVAGIDMLCEDITRPLSEQDGAIVEVNAAPGLRMHLHPTEGQARDVGTPIVEMLYPGSAPSRIPIIAVTGTNGKTTVTRLIGHMYDTARWIVGMTSTDGTYIGKERIMMGDCSGPRSAQAILLHPRVQVAVLETARGGILREGLAFDVCKVGLVTNVSADHLGVGGINTLEELASVKQVVIEAVADDGAAVLNADDPLVAEMAAATSADVIYFSLNPTSPVVQSHLAEEGRCVYARDNAIIMATGANEIELVELDRVPFTMGGKIRFQVQNALAAVAAAWGADLNPAMIVRALTTFKTDFAMTPGRFNITELNDVQIILDYGHNAAAVTALMEAVSALDERRTVMVMGLPGDRRDEDLQATIKATIGCVDTYILHDLLIDLRGRAPMEVPHLLRQALPPGTDCHFAAHQEEAVAKAWQLVQPGHRLIVLADLVDDAVALLSSLAESVQGDLACDNPLMRDLVEER
jgi:cyanophycin synthetase